MEEKCNKCGKVHDQEELFTYKIEETYEGEEYQWFFCTIECAMTYSDELLKEINDKKAEKLKTYLEGQKLRLDHPKFKL